MRRSAWPLPRRVGRASHFFRALSRYLVHLNQDAVSVRHSQPTVGDAPPTITADLVLGKTVQYRRRRATVRRMYSSLATVASLATGRPRAEKVPPNRSPLPPSQETGEVCSPRCYLHPGVRSSANLFTPAREGAEEP